MRPTSLLVVTGIGPCPDWPLPIANRILTAVQDIQNALLLPTFMADIVFC